MAMEYSSRNDRGTSAANWRSFIPAPGPQFAAMGRDWVLGFPEVVEELDKTNDRLRDQFRVEEFWERSSNLNEPLAVIQGQVSVGLLLTRILDRFDVRPNATLGYSLGESTALFAVGAWPTAMKCIAGCTNRRSSNRNSRANVAPRGDYWNLPEGTRSTG